MSYQVVIVEDDPMISLLNRSFVEKDRRFTVIQELRDGRAALRWFREHTADLMILEPGSALSAECRFLPSAVLVTILGNLVDNAIESLNLSGCSLKEITVTIREDAEGLFLCVAVWRTRAPASPPR